MPSFKGYLTSVQNTEGPELHFKADHCPKLHFKSGTLFRGGPLSLEFRGRPVQKSFIGGLLSGRSGPSYFEGPKEVDCGILKV
ncbi:hypothetical protein RclHR1_03340002 [Rhizophagus clarus]|uniref:Uncharacterized protein n=1 Tax=Rhizophagus clarus TaxID=94130 RepID=A0A2Z6RQL1_9GLOM|nr:hypothetical protein RclHR1_03340002 [Rhizophagus clarus]